MAISPAIKVDDYENNIGGQTNASHLDSAIVHDFSILFSIRQNFDKLNRLFGKSSNTPNGRRELRISASQKAFERSPGQNKYQNQIWKAAPDK
eukprot:8912864-Karenia_brevis.AAC.1